MTEGKDRLEYLEGMAAYVNSLLAPASGMPGLSVQDVQQCVHRIPFADQFLELEERNGRVCAFVREGAADLVHFDADRLGVAILDGRSRGEASTLYLETGRATPGLASIFSALTWGVSRQDLSDLATRSGINVEPVLQAFLTNGIVQEIGLRGETEPESLADREHDRVTWLGHAATIVQSSDVTIWVDPFVTPQIAWRADDDRSLFSSAFAEQRLFANYGPNTRHLALPDLPKPSAVLITHQDRDHLDLGVLMALPEETPIVVPRSAPAHPWEVDLETVIHRVLGSSRTVISLAHRESYRVGHVEVTAFPFRGEMPTSLPHSWNCYLVKSRRAAAAFMADSRLDEDELEFLVDQMRDAGMPLTLFAGPPSSMDSMPGWREGSTSTHLWSSERLWGWYLPVGSLFQPARCSHVTFAQLGRLAARANLRSYFPYARGSAPWFRIDDPGDAFHLPVASFDLCELAEIEDGLRALPTDLRLFPGQYGVPTRIDE
jgi:L-ascorbate metabolism protein UlaG (beta-lactamase superfamily)